MSSTPTKPVAAKSAPTTPIPSAAYSPDEITNIFRSCKHNPKPMTVEGPKGVSHIVRVIDRDERVVYVATEPTMDAAWQKAAAYAATELGGVPKKSTDEDKTDAMLSKLQQQLADTNARIEAIDRAATSVNTK